MILNLGRFWREMGEWSRRENFVLSKEYRSPLKFRVPHISEGLIARELERRDHLDRKLFEVNGCGRCLALVERSKSGEEDEQGRRHDKEGGQVGEGALLE